MVLSPLWASLLVLRLGLNVKPGLDGDQVLTAGCAACSWLRGSVYCANLPKSRSWTTHSADARKQLLAGAPRPVHARHKLKAGIVEAGRSVGRGPFIRRVRARRSARLGAQRFWPTAHPFRPLTRFMAKTIRPAAMSF